MKNKAIFRVLRIFLCLLFISSVFYLYLPSKSNVIDTMNTTVGEDHVDVLLIGSSHMYYGLNPIQMFRDYGYAAYLVGCGAQSPWQSFYYLKESCKKQTPSLVILDTYTMGVYNENDYLDYQTVNNLLDTPLSFNKIEAVRDSVAESKLNILLRFPYIHDDYDLFSGFELNKYYGSVDYSLGYVYDDSVEGRELGLYRTEDIRDVDDFTAISEKNEKYLRRIIEFCQHNGIEIILVNAPWPLIDEMSQMRFNYIAKVANEYNVNFIDGNKHWDEIGIDWETDSRGDNGHMNHSGVTKFTSYVEMIIHNKYVLPNRKDDLDYISYEEGIKWLEKEEN